MSNVNKIRYYQLKPSPIKAVQWTGTDESTKLITEWVEANNHLIHPGIASMGGRVLFIAHPRDNSGTKELGVGNYLTYYAPFFNIYRAEQFERRWELYDESSNRA